MTKQAKPFFLEELTRESNKNEVSFLLKLRYELKTPIRGIRSISSYLNENWSQLDDITRSKSVSAILEASEEGLTAQVDSLPIKTDGQEKINGIDSYTISVQDEGIGIPETELANIFVPFNHGYRQDSYNKDTGLGLAICREIVEAHGGTITASNNQTIDSTIEFSIPIKI